MMKMKKLNITKKQFKESKYFQHKYGKLEYVSESGKIYKTDKGNVLKFVKESDDMIECPHCGDWLEEDDGEICPSCGKSIYDNDNGDNGDSYPFTVTDIDWDTDGEDVSKLHLPETIEVDVPMECVDNGSAEVEDYISDFLSDTYGFCHNGFKVEGLDDKPMDDSRKNEDWFGIKGAKFIYHGDWADPEVQYDGISLNYFDVENILLDEYRELYPDDRNDKGFDNWMALPENKRSIQNALDDLVQGGCGEPIDESSDDLATPEFEEEFQNILD